MTNDEVFEATQRAKQVLRVEQSVLTHWVEGLTSAASAERLGCSARTVEYLRRHLQLTRGQAWRGGVQPMGRSCEMRLVVEVAR